MSQAQQTATSSRHLGAILAALAVVSIVAALVVRLWPSPDPETVFKQAAVDFQERRFSQAQVSLDQLARLRPATAMDSMMRAQLAIVGNRTEEALENLKRVPDDHKMAVQARFEAGHLEIQRGRFVAAERYLLQALKLDPTLVKARRELVYVYGTQLRREELDANFRILAQLSSLTYPEIFLWCLSRGVQWEADEIVQTLDRCVQADPEDRWARLGLVEGLRALSRFEEAEEMLAPLPDSDPEARTARVRLARARNDDVLAESLLASGPTDHPGLAILRGQLAIARGDGPEALRQFQIAQKLAPRLRETVFGLGQALQMTGDSAGAAPYLEEARKHDRLNSLIQRAAVPANRDDLKLIYDLGAACAALGRITEARAWYNLAVMRDGLDTTAQQALAGLKEPGEAKTNP